MALSPHSGRTKVEEQEEIQLGWRMAGLAFVMSSEAVAGALLGWLVDYFVGTGSTWLLVGAIVGIVVGMTSFIRGALSLNKMLAKQEKRPGFKLPKPLPPDEDDDTKDSDDDWKN